MAKLQTSKLPFFSRAYGGYTSAQEKMIRDCLGTAKGKSILDPMAGQGYMLSQLAWEGAHVKLGDINPATLLMASLRDPEIILNRHELIPWLKAIISTLSKKRRTVPKSTIVKDWIAPTISQELSDYAHLVGLGLFANPFVMKSGFWTLDVQSRFAAAIAVLAAREIACYRTSDNVTWLKPGGILRVSRISASLLSSLTLWSDFADRIESEYQLNEKEIGSITTELMNVEKGEFGETKKTSWIITSPPYANRLDYTRMWAPEINVLGAMCSVNINSLKQHQLGTTVVEGMDYSDREKELPRFMRTALKEIRSDPSKYSEVYYYPFFRNYAISLMTGLKHLAAQLRANGTLLVFVRDTVRKDVMFETGRLVTNVLTGKECRLVRGDSEKVIIRNHIGLVRKASTKSLYGLAQREWWLAFHKPSRSGTNGCSP